MCDCLIRIQISCFARNRSSLILISSTTLPSSPAVQPVKEEVITTEPITEVSFPPDRSDHSYSRRRPDSKREDERMQSVKRMIDWTPPEADNKRCLQDLYQNSVECLQVQREILNEQKNLTQLFQRAVVALEKLADTER